jgi:hypothetical protein
MLEEGILPSTKAMSEGRKPGKRVVSIGTNSNDLALRHAMLQFAGYEVWSTTKLPLALNFIQHERCGVLLLHYSLSEEWRQALITTFRRSCPGGSVIAIADQRSRWSLADVDATISESDGTAALLEALSRQSQGGKALSGEDERNAAD